MPFRVFLNTNSYHQGRFVFALTSGTWWSWSDKMCIEMRGQAGEIWSESGKKHSSLWGTFDGSTVITSSL